jgi:hypothetical protein
MCVVVSSETMSGSARVTTRSIDTLPMMELRGVQNGGRLCLMRIQPKNWHSVMGSSSI